jgi:hypothetical protein
VVSFDEQDEGVIISEAGAFPRDRLTLLPGLEAVCKCGRAARRCDEGDPRTDCKPRRAPIMAPHQQITSATVAALEEAAWIAELCGAGDGLREYHWERRMKTGITDPYIRQEAGVLDALQAAKRVLNRDLTPAQAAAADADALEVICEWE